ncbi:MAG: acyl-CoA dehydrogenase family protein [Solirubrobacteraceae bacterium]
MNLRDTPEEARFRDELRTWIQANLPAAAPAADAGAVEAHRPWSRALSDAGYAGLTWPREYGGAGRPPAYQAILAEELARAEAPGHIGSIGLNMAGPTLIASGTPEQKRRHLPRILSAEEIWCQGFSEPEAGSDLANVRTRGRIDPSGETIRVSGHKIWSSYAHLADWCILLVRTEPGSRRHHGLTFLLLDMRSPGVEVRPLRQLTGDAQFNELFFDDVAVPRDRVVGEIGQGWRVAMTTLIHERGTLGFALTGALDATVRRLAALVRERAPDDPLIRDRFAAAWIELEGLKLTNRRALAALADAGVPGPEASVSKLRWSELNQRVAHLALELLGRDALIGDGDGGDWRRLQLRSRGNTIEAGSSEVLRNIIAERVLGLPRSR